MSFIQIQTLDGGGITVAAAAVYRLRPSLPAAEMPDATKVEFGLDRQYTREDVHSLAERLRQADAVLVKLTSPNGEPVYLGRSAISVVKPSDAFLDPPEARSVLTVSGRRQAVLETLDQVNAALGVA